MNILPYSFPLFLPLDLKENSPIQRLSKVLKATREKEAADRDGLDETDSPNNETDQETQSEEKRSKQHIGELAFDEKDGGHLQDPDKIPNKASNLIAETVDCIDGVERPDNADKLKHKDLLLRDLKVHA